MDLEQEQGSKKKWIFIILGILLLVAIAIFALLRFGENTSVAKKIGEVLPFGEQSIDANKDGLTGTDTISGGDTEVVAGEEKEPLFRQLSKEPTAGATAIMRDGKVFVRYVLRENGHVHEVEARTGADTTLTNTTVLKVYEASFGNAGNSVALRFLRRDPLTQQDVIKTYLARIEVPIGVGSATDAVGILRGEYMSDNISAVSITPNGADLFYLLPIPEGVSGTVVSLTTNLLPKEIFRHSFAEWLPQIRNDGSLLLTTKPSAKIPGFAYTYQSSDKKLTRILREKDGLTTFESPDKQYVAYSENITDVPYFSIKGVDLPGIADERRTVPLVTLPEKCAWGTRTLYCATFTPAKRVQIPDAWYQGTLAFKDTFWSINPDNKDIAFVADPQKEIQKDFDVRYAFVDATEQYFFFINKTDDTLWSLRIPQKSVAQEEVLTTDPTLSPEELQDAAGSRAQ